MSDPAVTQVSWPPDRKLWAGALGGIVATAIISILAHAGYDLQPLVNTLCTYLNVPSFDIQATLGALIGLGIMYYMPPSMNDVIKRVDDLVIAIARASKNSPASAVAPPITPAVAAAVQEATGKTVVVTSGKEKLS